MVVSKAFEDCMLFHHLVAAPAGSICTSSKESLIEGWCTYMQEPGLYRCAMEIKKELNTRVCRLFCNETSWLSWNISIRSHLCQYHWFRWYHYVCLLCDSYSIMAKINYLQNFCPQGVDIWYICTCRSLFGSTLAYDIAFSWKHWGWKCCLFQLMKLLLVLLHFHRPCKATHSSRRYCVRLLSCQTYRPWSW